MKRLLLSLVLFVSSCATIPAPTLQPFDDGNDWLLTAPLVYEIGRTGRKVVVPAGFVTDLASVPRQFCVLLPSTDKYMRAAIVHDFLYWDQRCTKEQSDKTLPAAMIESHVPVWKKTIVYKGVQLGGRRAWQGNNDDRQSGFIRILPQPNRYIPSGVTWYEYRRQLSTQNVVEPTYERPDPAACTAYQAVTP